MVMMKKGPEISNCQHIHWRYFLAPIPSWDCQEKTQLDQDPAHHSTHSSLLTTTAFSLSCHSNPFEVFILLQNLYQLCIHLKQCLKKLLLHCQFNRQIIAVMMRLIWLGWESTLPGLMILMILDFASLDRSALSEAHSSWAKVSSWDDFHFL